jgi:hypothetical protein
MDLNAAAAGLAEASRLLSQSVMSGPDDLIELHFAFVRATRAKLCGAMAAWKDHLDEQTA